MENAVVPSFITRIIALTLRPLYEYRNTRRLNVVINRTARGITGVGIAVPGIKFREEQRVPAATGWSEEDENAVAPGNGKQRS